MKGGGGERKKGREKKVSRGEKGKAGGGRKAEERRGDWKERAVIQCLES